MVWCRLGCGNTLYNEKREYHEKKLCEWRFIQCPLCGEDVRERDKLAHMEIECVRGGHEKVIEFHEKEEAKLRAELETKEAEAKAMKDRFKFEKEKAEREAMEEKLNPNADKILMEANPAGRKGGGDEKEKIKE